MTYQIPSSQAFSKIRPFVNLAMATIMACSSIGCRTQLYTPAKAVTQEEAASTHLAVLSVACWNDRKDELQPKFDLSAENALLNVLPTTLGLEEKLLNALAAKLKVALPGNSFSSTDLSTMSQALTRTNATGFSITLGTNGVLQTNVTVVGGSTEGLVSADQRSNTKTLSSGDISNISFQPSPQGSNMAATLPGASVLSSAPQKDAMLQYWAAAALYQEVKLINRYVEDAAIATNYVPYLIRLQVSIMPRKRNLPYDAYTVLSFFPGRFETSGGPDTFLTDAEKAVDATGKEGVKVLPLLVTDDLEAALHSRSVDNVRQLALGLSAILQGVGLGVDLQKVDEELRTVLGYDFNSTFNVGRISDNTVQCRFGAMNQAEARFAMVPQAHNVTMLVLIPRNKKKNTVQEPFTRDMRVISKTELVHALTGKPLPATTRDDYHAKAKAILKSNGFICKTSRCTHWCEQETSDILQAVAANDFKKFSELLKNQTTEGATKYYESIWVELCQLRNSSQLGSVEFQVPAARPNLQPGFMPGAIKQQTVTAVDNGKALSVVLYWLKNIQPTKLGAFVELNWQGEKKRWPVTALEVQNEGRVVKLAFPSPASFGYTNGDGSAVINLALFSLDPNETFKVLLPTEYRLEKTVVKEEKTDPEKPGFDFAVPATVINASKQPTNGVEGSINVVISKKIATAKVQLEVDKADVVDILSSEKVNQNGRVWELTTNGVYTIRLRNLNPLEAVQLSARDASSKSGPRVKTVGVQFNEK